MTRPGQEWGKRKVESVMLSVGGNVIGFAGVLSTLLLPPNGYRLGPLIAREVGKNARAVCPYAISGKPITRLCEEEVSAEERIGALGSELDLLKAAMTQMGITAPVFHAQYPNPLIGVEGQPCDNNPLNDDRKNPIAPLHNAMGDDSFDGGFEALSGVIPKKVRGSRYSWGYELMYLPEEDVPAQTLLYRDNPKIQCDDLREPGDSEVCQALVTHKSLNDELGKGSRGWSIVDAHIASTLKHGVCVGDRNYQLAMPLTGKSGKSQPWRWQTYKPSDFDPYKWTDTRWFRTTNDSIQTQFGFYDGKPRFYHGTAHPTLRAHLHYANAIRLPELEQ